MARGAALTIAGERPRSTEIPSTPADRFFDYCLQPYAPREDPRGKLRGESLLWQSLEVAAVPIERDRIFRAIQRAAGRDMTVFGVKLFAGRLSWEVYFYDPEREDSRVTVGGLRDALRGALTLTPSPSDAIPYFMFSFDLDAESLARAEVDELNLYLHYYKVQGGHSYAVGAGPWEMRNTYRFHHPKREIEEIVDQLRHSVFVDFDRVRLSEVILPELFECQKICVAKKRFTDAIYFSGIDVDQLLWFLRRFAYPQAVIDHVADRRAAFGHLRFDVGIDYRSGEDGAIEYPKTGYYSTL